MFAGKRSWERNFSGFAQMPVKLNTGEMQGLMMLKGYANNAGKGS
jgi:hypothetical protein